MECALLFCFFSLRSCDCHEQVDLLLCVWVFSVHTWRLWVRESLHGLGGGRPMPVRVVTGKELLAGSCFFAHSEPLRARQHLILGAATPHGRVSQAKA